MSKTNCQEWPVLGFTEPDDADAGIVAAAKSSAQLFLSGLTGQHFGTCDYTQRFQIKQRVVRCSPASTGRCCAIKLPVGPVQSINAVDVGGVAIDPAGYTMIAGNRLIRSSGCWPSSPDTEPGRVVVEYTAGHSLASGSKFHPLVAAAMGEVTREYYAALTGGICKLPSRFVAVSRQGVSTQALDPALFLRLGLTGLPMTDNLVRTVNPNGLKRKPRVISIDGPRRH